MSVRFVFRLRPPPAHLPSLFRPSLLERTFSPFSSETIQPFLPLVPIVSQPSRPSFRRSIGSPSLASLVLALGQIGGLRRPVIAVSPRPSFLIAVAVRQQPCTKPEILKPHGWSNEKRLPTNLTFSILVGDAQRQSTSAWAVPSASRVAIMLPAGMKS